MQENKSGCFFAEHSVYVTACSKVVEPRQKWSTCPRSSDAIVVRRSCHLETVFWYNIPNNKMTSGRLRGWYQL